MKKLLLILLALVFVVSMVSMAAAKNPLAAAEKAGHKKLTSKYIPKNMIRNVDDMYKVWKMVMAGKSNAILLDVRTHPEFNAFHIARSSHIHSGHFYTIPKKIPNANAEIWLYCRTSHRSGYVTAYMYKWGYKKVYWVKGGIVAWVKKGYPVFNYYLGRIDKATYAKPPKWIHKVDKCAKPYCIREWKVTR